MTLVQLDPNLEPALYTPYKLVFDAYKRSYDRIESDPTERTIEVRMIGECIKVVIEQP